MTKKKPKLKTQSPRMVLSVTKMFEHLNATGLVGITRKEFRSFTQEDDFPIEKNKIDLVEMLAWLSIHTRAARGERINWQA